MAAVAALMSCPLLAGDARAQGQREFRIVNGTSVPITDLRYRTPGAGAFPNQNALSGQIAPGAQRRFGLDPNMACVWDIRVGFAGAEPTIAMEYDLCAQPEVRVNEPGVTDVVLRNRTNQQITGVHTRVPQRGPFGNNIIPNGINASGAGVAGIAYASLGCLRDVRVAFADGTQQTRRLINMCTTRDLEFDTPGRNEYIVENRGQQPLVSLHTRAPGGEWGEVRGLEAVQPGGLTSLQGNVTQTCVREVRAVFANRQEQTSGPIDICVADRVVVGGDQVVGVIPQGQGTTTSGQRPQGQQQQAPVAGPPPGARVVTVANTWHITLRELYLRTPGTQPLGPDVLGDRVLDSRREINVPLPGQGCRFDVLGLYGDEYGFTAEIAIPNADLCANRRVELNGPPPGRQLGGGTGFYATRSGLIVTNRHVTRMCNSVRLQVGGASVPLEILVDDPVNDLAILRGPSRATPAVVFRADGQPVRLGEQILAIGYPIGAAVGNQVFPVSGSISASGGRQGRDNEFSMTAPINPGHSGGPIFDESGLLVGVAVAGITRLGDRNIQNVTFGIRASVLRRLLRSINAEVEEAPPGQAIRTPDLIDRSLPMVLNLSCYS